METIRQNTEINELFEQLMALEPNTIRETQPAERAEVKARFLRGDTINPIHTYPRLVDRQGQEDAIRIAGVAILSSPDLNPKYAPVYEQFIEQSVTRTQMLQAMYDVKSATSEVDRREAEVNFMRTNIECYGAPDENVYNSLISEKLAAIANKRLTPEAERIFQELRDQLFPSGVPESEYVRFEPEEETVAWMNHVAHVLYDTMLQHVPDRETFGPSEIQAVFQMIIEREFEESAEGWLVEVGPGKSITVLPNEKRVVIPETRKPVSHEELQLLIVHELGLHFLHSIAGEQTDLMPLRVGLAGYNNTEEGLAKVMEQALLGRFIEAGVGHYLTAGIAYFGGRDFRDTFEAKWRLGLLESLADGEEISDKTVDLAKDAAYDGTMRIFRGTDSLPLFLDLSYYNGSVDTWKFIESIRGDDFRLNLLLMGKMSTSQDHLRVFLETHTP